MTLEETRHKIMTDDNFVLSELKSVQEIFRMKKVIRYHHKREEEVDTESVAEHIYGMLVLIDYFLQFEDTDNGWDFERIQKLTMYHDIDEILTGDVIGYLKTEADRARESQAQQEVVKLLPLSLQSKAREYLDEYAKQETMEAKFVKAIDKIEPLFHLINENGKEICIRNNLTIAQSRSIKDKYVSGFPFIKRFNEVLHTYMQNNDFFITESDTISK